MMENSTARLEVTAYDGVPEVICLGFQGLKPKEGPEGGALVREARQEAARRFLDLDEERVAAGTRWVDGRRAEPELQGFEHQLILPREVRPPDPARPPRLAPLRGTPPLRDWLRQVDRNAWLTRARQFPALRAGRLRHAPGDSAEGDLFAGDGLERHRPPFTEAVAEVSAEDALLRRMVLLDDVPRVQIARPQNVHSSMITHRIQRACQMIVVQREAI